MCDRAMAGQQVEAGQEVRERGPTLLLAGLADLGRWVSDDPADADEVLAVAGRGELAEILAVVVVSVGGHEEAERVAVEG